MTKRGIEISVGLFILFGIISFIVLSLRVSGLSDVYSGYDGYVVTADFDKIGGLKPRSRVTIGGVQVGRVVAIQLNQKKVEGDNTLYIPQVTMMLNKGVENLPSNTKAQILTAGLLGDNYLALDPGFFDEDDKKVLLVERGHIPLENTLSPIALEDIISKFVSSKASGSE